ncbi:MAG TPA: hypothetical protein ENI81_02670, partial [Phycisphaerales bacterium]|nr:hypothetical protein [Phycisphaerales bacterium]
MERSKKATGKGSRVMTAIKKNPAFICGILLCVIGVLFILVAISPASVGKVGRLVDERFLAALFGKASVLAGAYCLALGLVLLLVKSRVKHIAGLTCLFIPALVITDVLVGATPDAETGQAAVHGAYLGNVLRSTTTNYIGTAGTVLLMLAFVLGAFI